MTKALYITLLVSAALLVALAGVVVTLLNGASAAADLLEVGSQATFHTYKP